MSETAVMHGAEWLARALAGTGTTHVFFVESTLRRTLLHLSDLGRAADSRPLGEGRGLHGRRLCPHRRPARRLHGAVGRRGQPRRGSAGCVSRPQPGDRADRPQAAVVPAPQRLSGNPARAALRGGDEVFQPTVDATADLPRLLRQAWRAAMAELAAPDASRFLRPAGRCHRDSARRTSRRSIETERAAAMPLHRPAPTSATSSARQRACRGARES